MICADYLPVIVFSGGMLSVALSRSFSGRPRGADRIGRWALPTTASYGARTFLSPLLRLARRGKPRGPGEANGQRPSSRPADGFILSWLPHKFMISGEPGWFDT